MGLNFAKRREKLADLMGKKGIDAVLTSNHNDIFYYTGYAGLKEDRIFMVFPAGGKPKLIVTPLENEAEVKYSNVVFMSDVKDFLNQVKTFKRLGYDEKYMNVILFKELEKLNVKLEPVGKMLEIPRIVKEAYEIDQIKKAIRISKNVFGKIGSGMIGKSEMEVSNEIDIEFRKQGVSSAFESIVSSGPQGAFVHHQPNERVIKKKDGVLIDIGCRFNMYCSDLTRMFFKKLDSKKRKVYEDAKQIHNAVIDSIRAGVAYKDIESLQEKLFESKGYKVFHNFGHGVGLSVHDPVSNILNMNEVLTVEPGIYIKNVGGFRIEDMVLIKKGKAEVLSNSVPVF
ncbi:MAG: Xaa-Pro peptidase family protein [Candidatus Aenigmarchaeota archaeon]